MATLQLITTISAPF